MNDPSDRNDTLRDSDRTENRLSGASLQSIQQQISRWLVAALFTTVVAVGPAAAQETTNAEESLTSVIDTILGLIVDVGALILIAYAAINFVRIGINGVRGGPVRRFAITFGMAILLLMFQDVIEPFIRNLADTGAQAGGGTIIIHPEAMAMLAALPM